MIRNKRRWQRRQMAPSQEISLTPLIDTALTLLIIFMITAPMMQSNMLVQLPKGSAKEADTLQKELRVFIDKQSNIALNTIPMTREQLCKTVTSAVGSATGKSIYVEADKDVAYGVVVSVVDDLKKIEGLESVVFVMDTA